MLRRLTSLVLILCLLLGQLFSLAHGVEHTLADRGDTVCLTCLSSQHQPSLPAAVIAPLHSAPRHPAFETAAARRADGLQLGYCSRAPPRISTSQP